MKKLWLWVEWSSLFILAPVLVGQIFRSTPWVIFLIVITIGAAVWLRRRGNFSVSSFWRSQDEGEEQRQLKRVLLRFLLCGFALVVATMALFPEKLFAFPRAMPLRCDDEHAILGQPASGKPLQPRAYRVGEAGRPADVEPQLHRGLDLLDILSTGARRAQKILVQFTLVERNASRDRN